MQDTLKDPVDLFRCQGRVKEIKWLMSLEKTLEADMKKFELRENRGKKRPHKS